MNPDWLYVGDNIVAAACKRCGALVDVSDKEIHDRWHEELAKLTRSDTPTVS